MRNVPYTTLLLMFLRTYLVGAAFNMRGLQNVGFMYVMEPGLRAVHRDMPALRRARGRYVRHYNCHPFWTPLVAGMFLRTEYEIAKGGMTPAGFLAIKETAANTLSAIGDSVFGGSLLVTWSLLCAFLVMAGQNSAALGMTAALFVGLQFFRLCTFAAGVRYGIATLFWLRRYDLINWGDRFKLCNALLLLGVLSLCIPWSGHPSAWIIALIAAVPAAKFVVRLNVPRGLLAVVAAVILVWFV